MKHLIFDLETVPDYAGLRRIMADSLPDAKHPDKTSDDQVLLAYWKKRKPDEDDETLRRLFLPVHLHRVVTIGLALWDNEGDEFKLWSLYESDSEVNAASAEAQLLQRFFDGIGKHTPQLVSWNGSGFDLPVLHHRALIHGIAASRYWEVGEQLQAFRYNNYINRYHYRHLDLMDVLAAFNGRNYAKLDDMAKLCGMPGKHGMEGAEVAGAFAEGRINDIRLYCEADVLNTMLLYIRYLKITERLSATQHEHAVASVRHWLDSQNEVFWKNLAASWQ